MNINQGEQQNFAQEEKENRKRYWPIVLTVITLSYLPELFIGMVVDVWGISLHYYHIILFLQVMYFVGFGGMFTVKQSETGAIFLFGKYQFQLTPGFWVGIPGVYTYQKDIITTQQWEIPTDLPDRYNGERTIRITTKPESKSGGSKDPLATGRLTLEGSFLISVRLDNSPGAYRQFVERVGSMDNFLQIADDEVVNRIAKEVVKKSPSEVFEEWEDLEKNATDSLKSRIGEFGFAELSVKAKGFDLPRRVNEALADRTAAHVAVETGRFEGERQKLLDVERAKGIKALARAPLAGRFEALTYGMENGVVTNAEQALFINYTQTLGEELKNANYTLLPQGNGGMLDPASQMAIMQEAIRAAHVSKNKEKSGDGGDK